MRIPLWIKVAYLAWLVLWMGHYLSDAGAQDFTQIVWFCYVGLLVFGMALWLESPLLVSWQAVALVIPQLIFTVDALAFVVLGRPLVPNLADYIFDPELSLVHRLLSLFHVVMPFCLLWAVWRLGYDRRALFVQIGACWVLLLLSYFITNPYYNVNYVFGPGETQNVVPSGVYLALCMVAYPLLIYLPTHLLLLYFMPRRTRPTTMGAAAAGTGVPRSTQPTRPDSPTKT